MKSSPIASRYLLSLIVVCVGIIAANPLHAASDPTFLRVVTDKSKVPVAFETAIVRFTSTDPKQSEVVVDLVGAVHVGDKKYYELLNKRFEAYDALLYELVAPSGHQAPNTGERPNNPLSAIQKGIKNALELEFQLDHINYDSENFVHADMTPEQFVNSMVSKQESIWAMVARLMLASYSQQAKKGASADLGLLFALLSPNKALAFKRMLAREFLDMDVITGALNGPDGSTIITERNKIALEILKEQLVNGKKKIGIFYGAAHLADFEERLVNDFGMKRTSVSWVEAWDLRSKKK